MAVFRITLAALLLFFNLFCISAQSDPFPINLKKEQITLDFLNELMNSEKKNRPDVSMRSPFVDRLSQKMCSILPSVNVVKEKIIHEQKIPEDHFNNIIELVKIVNLLIEKKKP